jgi:death-on-curing protein
MDEACKTLTIDEVVEINRQVLAEYGGLAPVGSDNMVNPEPLGYVLEAVQGLAFELSPYPTIYDKAAAVAWAIIRRHVFYDGNKRTGMLACQTMLELNGYSMGSDDRIDFDDKLAAIAVSVAKETISFADFAAWLAAETAPLPSVARQ